MARPIPDAAFTLLRDFEGCRLTAYRDGAGIWTIGYGHTRGVDGGMVITDEDAESFLHADAEEAGAVVERTTPMRLNDNQFSALVDFVFNLGGQAYAGSTMRRDILALDYEAAANEFGRWVHDHTGAIEPGLVRRRQAERQLWLTPPESA